MNALRLNGLLSGCLGVCLGVFVAIGPALAAAEKTRVEVAAAVNFTSEARPILAALAQILGEPRGRGLAPIRLVGQIRQSELAGGALTQVVWQAVTVDLPKDPRNGHSANLTTPLTSAFHSSGTLQVHASIIAEGDVAAMIEAARKLLEEGAPGANKRGKKPGGDGSGDGSGVGTAGAGNAAGSTAGVGAGTGSAAGANGDGTADGTDSGLTTAARKRTAASGSSGSSGNSVTDPLLSDTNGLGSLTGGTSSGSGGGSSGSGGSSGAGTASGIGSTALVVPSPVKAATTTGTTTTGTTTTGTTTTGTTSGGNTGTTSTTAGANGSTTSTPTIGTSTVTTDAIAITQSTDGCSPRWDKGQDLVIIQTKTVTTTNGQVTNIGACQDTLERYQVKVGTVGCADQLSISSARPTGKKYWVDSAGSTNYLTNCAPYDDRVFPFSLDSSQCPPTIDLTGGLVTENSRQVYTNANNAVVIVGDCASRTSTFHTISWTADGCGYRHDWSAKKSYQEFRRIYLDSTGQTHEVAGCQDHTAGYAWVTTTTGCPPFVDTSGLQVIQYQQTTFTDASGEIQTVTGCTPATSTIPIVATEVGCEGQYVTFPASNISYATMQYQYTLNGRVYPVTGCIRNPNHSFALQADPGSPWEHDDNCMCSWQVLNLYIDTPTGRVVVSTKKGTVVNDYGLVNQTRVDVGNPSWSGCTMYQPTAWMNTYQRSDGTKVTLQMGDAGTITSADGCSPLPDAVAADLGTTDVTSCDYVAGQGWETVSHGYRMVQQWENGAGEVFQGSAPYDSWVVISRTNLGVCDASGSSGGGG